MGWLLALLWLSSDLLPPVGPPTEPGAPSQLGMPGDRPIEWTQPPAGIDFAFVMEGQLVEVGSDQVVIRRPGLVDAVIFLDEETLFFAGDETVPADGLPVGGASRVTFTLRGAERVALQVQAMEPGEELPPANAAAPIVPIEPGARSVDGLPPGAAPAAPVPEEPPLPERDTDED